MTVDLAKLIERLEAALNRAGREWSYYPLVSQAAESLSRLSGEREAAASRIAELERAIADELFLNRLGEIGYVGLRDFAAMQARAETAERQRDEAISFIRTVADDSYLDDFTHSYAPTMIAKEAQAFIRSLNSPGGA